MKPLKKVKYTNGIPLSPYCKVPTPRTGSNYGTSTAMYFPPQYNEEGININPDRNIHTQSYQCNKCGKGYSVSGNEVDGYRYNT